jgi:hypothetical protein
LAAERGTNLLQVTQLVSRSHNFELKDLELTPNLMSTVAFHTCRAAEKEINHMLGRSRLGCELSSLVHFRSLTLKGDHSIIKKTK